MKGYDLVIFKERCHGCGNCVVACPVNAQDPNTWGGKGSKSEDVVIRVENGTVELVKPELCGGCGACVEACPVDAIKLVVRW
ncbi:4Fe-4S ferredoxin iron-sulfur binding domain protein [Methanocaldococcus infernus ME]|uniref:4Fe-4S ferredoxin iron-sulfur binding domain protein n=1 Tax=Methanocaldococcus infernus (strain DSM 11812 / JCM 15783 / ME) TaxID=573063 RepID=D5VT81_METIM|nr:4Fe-4S binding protein [Methanocaldococcus infernus]ADG13784.1 4Fe-4S ferredoxin iron-sulfur binding domain protein [Methanocaldococcus infernus ME]